MLTRIFLTESLLLPVVVLVLLVVLLIVLLVRSHINWLVWLFIRLHKKLVCLVLTSLGLEDVSAWSVTAACWGACAWALNERRVVIVVSRLLIRLSRARVELLAVVIILVLAVVLS